MKFLPIAERELRVAARKRSTPWFRVLAALLALLLGAGFLGMSAAFGVGTVRFGPALFGTLTWLALAASLSAGLFFTADSLSEEKREGTLGFLFLTDLYGYDVVAGKLLATSLRAFYGLLALLPILGVTLLMGGVTGAQFSKTALALMNALFCSLAIGLLASALCRDAQRAMATTLVFLLVFCAGGPLLDAVLDVRHGPRPGLRFSLSSPVYVFWGAGAWGRTNYWQGLLVSDLLAWAGFGAACWLTPRTWQDRPRKNERGLPLNHLRFSFGRQSSRRAKLLSHNPVLWLALRERWQSVVLWAFAAALMCGVVAISSQLPRTGGWLMFMQGGQLIMLLIYLWAASHACRLFLDARRSGLLELLLVTPLSGRQIVSGHWRALFRLFGFPCIGISCVGLMSSFLSQHSFSGYFSSTPSGGGLTVLVQIALPLINMICAATNVAALIWVGMWLGLTSKNISLATLQTILFVQVLPSLGIMIAGNSLTALILFPTMVRTATPSLMAIGFPLLSAGLTGILTVTKDIAFVGWARARLFSRFRIQAAQRTNAAVQRRLVITTPTLAK